MSRKTFTIIVIVFLVSLWAAVSHGEIYKWVDKDGNVTFSGKKPADPAASVETIKTRQSRFGPSEASAEDIDEEDRIAAAREKELKRKQEEQAKADAEATLRTNNCASVTRRYVSLQRPRVNEVAADGTRTVLGEDVRQAELAKFKKLVDEWCE